MNSYLRNTIVAGTFLLVAIFGLSLSFAAPYTPSADELVYLTGALQAQQHNLPDAYMLQGYDDGPYLYPKIMLVWYESLGYYAFKSIYLVVLILATGLSAYAMFRLLWLPWVPSLLMAVVVLIPRFSAGTEIFGVLTFHEAIGRQAALALFLVGTAFLIRRFVGGRPLWPIFGVFGLLLFLHPVTVMLFAFISLVALFATRIFQRSPIQAIREALISGVVFLLAGSYFFIGVFEKLANGVASQGVSAALYVQAITSRNTWEFSGESLLWFRHMAVVSAFFVIVLIIFYSVPKLRAMRAKYPLPHSRELIIWGLAVAIGALVLTIALPGINLYFMEHANAPYIFQQWSRISKFYYLGLFVSLIPALHVLWQWFLESKWRFKTLAVALLFLCGIASSSFGFEIAQFAVGFKNFEPSYIPQALSGIPDGTTPAQYREVCQALNALGVTSADTVISGNFAFRYYCKANLYVTFEEGAAYQQLTRADVVEWDKNYLAQTAAFKDADPKQIDDFAKSINAHFVIVSSTPKNASLAAFVGWQATTTTKYIVIKTSN